jgi:hypothetical protein
MAKLKNISTQDDWDILLGLISEGTLTPVIGKEMYQYIENDQLLPIDNFLTKNLLEKFESADQTFNNLTDAVNYLVNEKTIDSEKIEKEDIVNHLNTAIKKIEFEFPLLTDLLKIVELKYFVNTTIFYDILEKKVKAVRQQETDFKNFSPNGSITWAKDLAKLNNPLVFNVFGSSTEQPAIGDEDLLEFTSQFNEKLRAAPNLEDSLKIKNLLFIGCAYPGWMIRLALRVFTLQPMSQWGRVNPIRKIYVINDQSSFREEQNKILQNYKAISYEGGTKEFMAELLNQWKKKSGGLYDKPKSVFLSYTRDDKAAVENLEKALELLGNIKCWYDKRELKPGDDWEREIIVHIRDADIFIPLISANSLQHEDGYVQKEWFQGHNEWKYRIDKKISAKYLIPVVIDDSPLYGEALKKHFDTDIHITKIPQGIPDGDFLDAIKKILGLV